MENSESTFAATAEKLSRNPLGIIALFIVLVYAMAAVTLGLSSTLESNQKWPIVYFLVLFPVLVLLVFTILVAYFHKNLYGPGDFEDQEHFTRLALAVGGLAVPRDQEIVTYAHVTLLHSSWRYPKKDEEYKRKIWAFHLVVVASDDVMKRIESVSYSLHPSYPKDQQRKIVEDRSSRFCLKQLAWDESVIRASIRIKGQAEDVKLNRYIDLAETGPRIA